MATLLEKCNLIKQDKEANLKPENLREGVTCLGVTGELEEGIDTSDATATHSDILDGKTAYVNGEMVTGTVGDLRGSSGIALDGVSVVDDTESGVLEIATSADGTIEGYDAIAIDRSTELKTYVLYNAIADSIGLTADKLLEGNTILGIEGTATAGSGKADLSYISFYSSNLGATKLLEELGKIDTASLTETPFMFDTCQMIMDFDLTSIEFGDLTNMCAMFRNCYNVKTLNVSHLNTDNVTNMNYLFAWCNNLEELDISSFNFSNVESYSQMFTGIPADCLIYVKDQTAKDWVLTRRSDLTNVQIKNIGGGEEQ